MNAMMAPHGERLSKPAKPRHPFRSAVLRGLGVLAPPLLTVLIFLWIGSTVNQYVLRPVTALTRDSLVWLTADIRDSIPGTRGDLPTAVEGERVYRRMSDGKYVPLEVFDRVARNVGEDPEPRTAWGVYRQYVTLTYLHSLYLIPFILAVFTLLLYLLGKFMAAGIGRFFVSLFEWGIDRLPLVRSVYSGVKQVSDFMFNEREIEFTRVVAVEYPRKGVWSVGFVTGEGFFDIRSAANEEAVVSVFIPASPFPVSGFMLNCPRNELVDLNLTFDQACQYLISCGVVIPSTQLAEQRGRVLEAAPAAPDAPPVETPPPTEAPSPSADDPVP